MVLIHLEQQIGAIMSEMQINTEELEFCKIKVNYLADSDVVKSKRTEAIKQLRGQPVPGFRPGKATDTAIKVKFKDKINDWVSREMLQQANDDILFETKMRPIGNHQVKDIKLDGTEFKCELVYLKKPDFELADYKEMEIPAPHLETTIDQLRESMFQTLREQNGETRPYEENDFVQTGDVITIDYAIHENDINGKVMKKEDGAVYEVGSNKLPGGFDDALSGMAPDEKREFALQGEAFVVVTVLAGTKKEPCPLDDSLAKKLNIENFDTLKGDVQAAAEKQLKSQRDQMIATQIKNRLVADNDFEVPPWLLNMEAQQIAAQEGVKWDDLDDAAKETFNKRGKDQIKFALIMDSIRLDEPEVQLGDEESIQLIRQRLTMMGVPNVQQFIVESAHNGRLAGMISTLRNDYAMQWLVDHSKIVE